LGTALALLMGSDKRSTILISKGGWAGMKKKAPSRKRLGGEEQEAKKNPRKGVHTAKPMKEGEKAPKTENDKRRWGPGKKKGGEQKGGKNSGRNWENNVG